MIPKKPDSITPGDVEKRLGKEPLKWTTNVPSEGDQLLMWIHKKGYSDITKKRVEKYLKEKGLI